jgi:hypothetical protein
MPPAVERFEDDVLLFGVEVADRLGRTRHQGRRREWRELHQREFFGVVAQRARAVEHAGTFAFGLFQQVGGVEELAVERRVLAHEHGVEVPERLARLVVHAVPVVGFAREGDAPHQRADRMAALPLQVLRLAGGHGVATFLQLAHHGEGGVLVGLEGGERIGDKKDVHGGFKRLCGQPRTVAQTARARRRPRPRRPSRCRR